MPLSWNEIKSRAMAFSRRWQDAAEEKQQSIPFWIDFFDIFGVTNRRVASFEHAVKKHGGGQGYIDLFWPGQMLVEQKSRGKPLEPAYDQAMGYFPGLPERDLPHTLVVCDFARFRVIDLDARREITFALAVLHKHVRWFGFIAGYKAQQVKPQDPVNVRAAERIGRLESRYRYSAAIVYNNFPWPFCAADSEQNAAPAQVEQASAAIKREAQAVLDARAEFPGSSLADLYDPLSMPPALLRAHQKLDVAVDRAYQLAGGPKSYNNDAERVAFLFTRYQRLTSLLPAAANPKKRRNARSAARGGLVS